MTPLNNLGFDPEFLFVFCLYSGVLLALGLAALGLVRSLRGSARNASRAAAAQQEQTRLLAESVALQKENNALLKTLLDRLST